MNKSISNIAFFSILLFANITNSLSDTNKSGIINKNERWIAEDSPYIITDDILIAENTSLVITPGVRILVGKPVSYESGIPQLDHLDSFTVSIKIEGRLKCIGRTDNRITFSSQYSDPKQCQWYGIILDNPRQDDIEIAFCDIADACNGLTIKKGTPLIRNSIFEFNNVGVFCSGKSKPMFYNCIVAYNLTSGVRIQESNPSFINNIIAFNKSNGIWSDDISHISLEYNCLFGNIDGDITGCNPELGIISRVNKNKDSTDFAHNIYTNPIFAGSPADSQAVESDYSLNTDKSRIKDTTIAKVLHDTLTDSTAIKKRKENYKRYSLSSYSPCINAGNPGKHFRDIDGSRNDIGIFGGQEFVDFSKNY